MSKCTKHSISLLKRFFFVYLKYTGQKKEISEYLPHTHTHTHYKLKQLKPHYIPHPEDLDSMLEPKPEVNPLPLVVELEPVPHPRLAELVL